MIYVLLGMHKSGTTLVSRLLHESGIDMGSFDIGKSYDQGNQFERSESLDLNNSLLQSHGVPSLHIDTSKKLHFDASQIERGKKLIENLDRKHKNWGFKDPRTCLTYEFWRSLLPSHKIIVIYRNPNELAKHYGAWTRNRYLSLKRWHDYNQSILNIVEGKEKNDVLIVRFDALIHGDEELIRLSEFLGVTVSDCRQKSLYRNREKIKKVRFQDELICQWLYGIHLTPILNQLSNNPHAQS